MGCLARGPTQEEFDMFKRLKNRGEGEVRAKRENRQTCKREIFCIPDCL